MKKVLVLFFVSVFFAFSGNFVFADETQTQNKTETDKKIQKAFEIALDKENFENAKECLKNGADINKECYLCYAIINKKENVFDFLIENGANPNGTSKMWTPLYFAVHDKNNSMLDKLLQQGADPNKETAVPLLYHSVVKKNPYAFEKLLWAGADPKKTFMKINAVELAFANDNKEMIDTIIKFQQKDFKKPATDINKAIELLNTIQNGKPFYRIIKGENELNKPVKVEYINLSTFGDYNTDVYFSVCYLKNKELTIFIDNRYANEPPEVIALLIAGNSIHIDKKNSQVEYLYQLGVQALIYEEFLTKNPKLKDNKNSYLIQKNFNRILALLQMADYDMNIYWRFVKKGMFGNGLKETSPGFRNKDLNSYFESK